MVTAPVFTAFTSSVDTRYASRPERGWPTAACARPVCRTIFRH